MHSACHSQHWKMQLPQTQKQMLHPRLQQPSCRPQSVRSSWWQATVSSGGMPAACSQWEVVFEAWGYRPQAVLLGAWMWEAGPCKQEVYCGGRRCQVSGCSLLLRVGGYCQYHTVDSEGDNTDEIDQLILDLVLDSTSCSIDWEGLGMDDLDLTSQEDDSMMISQLVL
ncbi:hypothetical protein AC1031_012922 [Aphanomyces cochlioides]|nr:hypothetical protein AC1031_012922 [Aphanomyces cochlioides]